MQDLNRFAKLFDLTGHVAVVTGAAQGNGMGIANALCDAGATVVAADLVFASGNEQIETGLRPDVIRMGIDVTNEENVREVFAKIAETYGKLDILCNNAGIIYKDFVQDLDIEKFRKVSDINIHGVVICTKHAVPYMKKAGWGRIVNVSSSQAFLTTEMYSAYSASKAAVSHLTRIWGNELAADNILVHAICPSFVRTPMMERSIAHMAELLGTDVEGGYNYFADMIPTHRLLEIEEIGNWATMLCSDLGRATTGSNFSITCGQVRL